MEKLTDAEIIKALEDYKNSKILQTENGVISIGDILDLINRKDAEIERLKRELISADEVIGYREAEIKRLQEVTTNTVNSSIRFGLDKEQEIRKAKSEAYKEFAERLHQKCKKYPYTLPSVFTNIEITYKELTEGGNEDG